MVGTLDDGPSGLVPQYELWNPVVNTGYPQWRVPSSQSGSSWRGWGLIDRLMVALGLWPVR
jgi:hypothetical protein